MSIDCRGIALQLGQCACIQVQNAHAITTSDKAASCDKAWSICTTLLVVSERLLSGETARDSKFSNLALVSGSWSEVDRAALRPASLIVTTENAAE